MRVTTEKTHYCAECKKKFHYLGWPRHRAMHFDRKTRAPNTEDMRLLEDLEKANRRADHARYTELYHGGNTCN